MRKFTYLLSIVCISMWSMAVSGQNFYIDGYRYEVNDAEKHTVTLLATPGDVENLALPSETSYEGTVYTVTKVDCDAVSYKTKLKTVSFPATITEILYQSYAFEHCDLLESITVDEGNTAFFAQDGALYEKSTVNMICLPRSVRGKVTLADGAKDRWGGSSIDLSDMPNVEEIVFGKGIEGISLNNMPSLTTAYFPSSMTSLGIENCPSLDNVSVGEGGIYSSSNNVIYVNMEVYVNNETVEGRGISFMPYSMTEYVVPDDVVYIPDMFFVNHENLVSLSVSGNNNIFYSDGNAIYTANEYMGGSTLVDAAGGLTEIALRSDLSDIKAVEVPVDDEAFEPHQNVPFLFGMKKLASITMPTPNEMYMAAAGVLMRMLPDYDAFFGKSGWSVECVPPAITGKVVLPEGTVDVSPSAFYGTAITSVTIPDGCFLSYASFAHCKNLSEVIFTGNASAESTAFFDTPWLLNHEPGVIYAGTTAIGIAGTPKEIVIKEGTKSIGKEAFAPFSAGNQIVGGFSLEKVTLPEGLEKMESMAFYGCTKLKSVNIPASLKEMGNNVFGYCLSLSDVKLGEGLTFLPDIYEDLPIPTIYVPASVERWDAFRFNDVTASFEVSPDNQVFASQGGILYDKQKTAVLAAPPALVNAVIPEGCVSIGVARDDYAKSAAKASAYEDMAEVTFGEKLETVSLPSTLQNIYSGSAFYESRNLKECRVFNSTPIELYYYAFPDDLQDATLYVPQGSENAYRNADVWNRFNTIEGFDVTGIDNATVAGELRETGRYSLDGRRLESPEKGINIVRMSDGSVRKVMVK